MHKEKDAKMTGSGYERFEKAVATLDQLSKATSASSRISAVSADLNGLVLTGATTEVGESIEAFGVEYNRLMPAARESTEDEDANLSEPDAAELVSSLRATCELSRSSETDRVLQQLREPQGSLPRAEIDLIRRYTEWFAPILLQECVADTEKIRQRDSENDASGSGEVSSIAFFSLYLASELDLAEFVPVVLRGLRLPNDLPFDLYGDAIHECVPRYLTQFLHSDIDRIDELTLDPSHNTYVRWCAAGSYKYLVRDKVLTLEEAVRRLDHLFEATKITDETGGPALGHDYEVSAGIVEAIASIGGGELSDIGDSPDQWIFIDKSIIPPDDFVDSVAPTDPAWLTDELRRLPATRFKDCVEELRRWAWFNESADKSPAPVSKPASRPRPNPSAVQSQRNPEATTAVRSDRTPRNADCPCGSGKKYKKCCMRT